jgi:hypothetical protein
MLAALIEGPGLRLRSQEDTVVCAAVSPLVPVSVLVDETKLAMALYKMQGDGEVQTVKHHRSGSLLPRDSGHVPRKTYETLNSELLR